MPHSYYHIGIIVANLDAAIPKFARVFHVSFTPPRLIKAGISWHGTELEYDVRVAYSREQPQIELLEGHKDGYFSLKHGEGFHHLGLWSPDYDSSEWHSRFDCSTIEAVLPKISGAHTVMLSPASLCGIRVEVRDQRNQAELEAWIASSLIER
jgi:Glyoxalase/Bleomycin resistance protein/Dioxygenase superfamily